MCSKMFPRECVAGNPPTSIGLKDGELPRSSSASLRYPCRYWCVSPSSACTMHSLPGHCRQHPFKSSSRTFYIASPGGPRTPSDRLATAAASHGAAPPRSHQPATQVPPSSTLLPPALATPALQTKHHPQHSHLSRVAPPASPFLRLLAPPTVTATASSPSRNLWS